jgi:alanine dehydrogenase
VALNNATLPYIVNIANKGYKKALLEDPHLLSGLNVYRGKVTCRSVADSLGLDYVDAIEALKT